MKNISEIDSNFKVETKIDKQDIKFYDIAQAPFKIYGVSWERDRYRRMPEAVAEAVSEKVYFLHSNTAGGRVRFKTDSPYIAIHAEMPKVSKMSHFSLTASIGMDLYCADYGYSGTFIPPFETENGFESVLEIANPGMHEYTINMPLYSDVSKLYIGLSETATVCEADPYKTEKPVVYYGSSITQGGCASRPGCAYQSILTRQFSCDHINLGFSGSALGEKVMADYLSGLDMSVFVLDYDCNSPTPEHLQNTHEAMFQRVRSAHPELPIIILSRPFYYLTKENEQRLEIIRTTYRNAVESGDKNVYLIEGSTLLEMAGNDGSVDRIHPTDLGFASMAKAIAAVMEKILPTP